MFMLLAIFCMMIGAGLMLQSSLLGGLAIFCGFGFAWLSEQFPVAEERFWAVIWLLGAVGIVGGVIHLLFFR